jgi:hypothetical protein
MVSATTVPPSRWGALGGDYYAPQQYAREDSSLRAHSVLEQRLDQELRAAHGMTLTTYDALVQLSEAPERRLRMKELALLLVYSAPR